MIPLILMLQAIASPSMPASQSDYPTSTRADYVIGCMAANGQSFDMLQRCSCSIDTIASILPYADYVQAETVMRMREETGERASLIRDARVLTVSVQRLREAQVEADFRCF